MVVVDVPEAVQVDRTMRRDDNSESLVKQIMAAQLDRQTRLSHADEAISNDDTLEALHAEVEALHKRLLERARVGD